MNVALLTYSAALICVMSRGFLNVFDRYIFKQSSNVNFTQVIFLNALLPFIVGFIITKSFFPTDTIKECICNFAVIINALGAQAAATAFSNGFRNMTVRNLCASTKIADLFIPLFVFLITRKFSITEYLFSCASVLIFIPIFLHINKGAKDFCLKSTLFIFGILIFQVGVNIIFNTHEIANTTVKFYSFMCGILFWRVMFVLPIAIIKNIPLQIEMGFKSIAILTLRAFLAFFSQASFFFSVTRVSSVMAWPVLNSGPLISCVIAHFLIKEHLKKPEYITMLLFSLLSSIYIIYTWSTK